MEVDETLYFHILALTILKVMYFFLPAVIEIVYAKNFIFA
jgi:hypothetical protein